MKQMVAPWGFARILRLEHPALRTQSIDVPHCAIKAATPSTFTSVTETEATLIAMCTSHGCVHAPHRQSQGQCLQVACTRSAVVSVASASCFLPARQRRCVSLAARVAQRRVARDGQGLAAQLQSMGAVAAVLMCDSADAHDTNALLSANSLIGVLHAAGAGDTGLLIELFTQRVHWMFATKTMGAWFLNCAAASAPLDSRLLFSSVGSGLGNVGQGQLCSRNAYLDAHAFARRARGATACCLQWPLVGGAGMGAAVAATMGERGGHH